MIDKKDLELSLLLKESMIQQLKLKILKLEQEIERLKQIVGVEKDEN